MEYNDILTGKVSLGSTITRYDIDTVIVPVEGSKRNDDFILKLISFGYKFLEGDQAQYYASLTQQVLKFKFKEIYRDNVSVIYQKSQ